MMESIESQVGRRDNPVAELEAEFRAATGLELVRAPIESILTPAELAASVSVIIPAWNSGATLPACLRAIERSTLNRAAPHLLDVVVVDDGSTDGTWGVLDHLDFAVNLTVLWKEHGHSRAHTHNLALAHAAGEIVVSCDADVVLAPFALEELARRHQALPSLLLLGFFTQISKDSPALPLDAIEPRLFAGRPDVEGDPRLERIPVGWPEHVMRDTDHLANLGRGRTVYDARGRPWDLPHLLYGALFSMRRSDWLAIGGYDERFVGWGSEDTLLAARAIAHGLTVAPVYSAVGWHVTHPPRDPRKREEAAGNRARYETAMREPWRPPADRRWLDAVKHRAKRRVHRAASFSPPPIDRAELEAPYRAVLDRPGRRGRYLASVGRFDEAIEAFGQIAGSDVNRARAAVERAKSLWAAGRTDAAVAAWSALANEVPPAIDLFVGLAMATAELGDARLGRAWLDRARTMDANDRLVRFVIGRSAADHLARGDSQAANGHLQLALREYTAALLVDPVNDEAEAKRRQLVERSEIVR